MTQLLNAVSILAVGIAALAAVAWIQQLELRVAAIEKKLNKQEPLP